MKEFDKIIYNLWYVHITKRFGWVFPPLYFFIVLHFCSSMNIETYKKKNSIARNYFLIKSCGTLDKKLTFPTQSKNKSVGETCIQRRCCIAIMGLVILAIYHNIFNDTKWHTLCLINCSFEVSNVVVAISSTICIWS